MNDTRNRFLRVFWILLASALSIVVLINLTVDPYGMLGTPTVSGFNQEKIAYQRHLRMIKAHSVRVLRPRGLIMGTSRAEWINPDHPGWKSETQPVFNLAMQSARIHEVYRYLQHAQAQEPLHTVVIGLDRFMFNPAQKSESGFDEARLDLPQASGFGGWMLDFFRVLVSYDAFAESLETVFSQNNLSPVIYRQDGSRVSERYAKAIELRGGQRKLFFSEVRWGGGPDRKPLPVYDPWATFSELLRFARENDIDLRLFISPVHAFLLELYWQTNAWGEFEQWKTQLVEAIAKEASQHRVGGKPFPLWDFSGYNTITLEPIPAIDDAKTQMRWYWEGSHYTEDTGTLILDKIFSMSNSYLPPDFGIRLSRDNLSKVLAETRERRALYTSRYPKDIADIKSLLAP